MLDHGTFGRIFECVRVSTGQVVAIKVRYAREVALRRPLFFLNPLFFSVERRGEQCIGWARRKRERELRG